MKKFLAAAIAATAFSAAPALAAPPAAPLFSWSGFYAGLNAGYGWGQSNTATTINDPGATNFSLAAQPFYNANMSPHLHPDGFIGGGQIGYNLQSGNAVFGMETDFQYFHLNDPKTTNVTPPVGGSPLITHTSVNTDWLFTARARVGMVFDRTLLYATGGVALTNLNYAQNNFFSNCGSPPPVIPTCSEAVSVSNIKTGWTIGGGLDYMLNNNWSMRAEYLYVDFGGVSGVGILGGDLHGTPGMPFNHSGNLIANIVRTAINYKY